MTRYKNLDDWLDDHVRKPNTVKRLIITASPLITIVKAGSENMEISEVLPEIKLPRTQYQMCHIGHPMVVNRGYL
jgi:hypothetical protein